MNHVIGLHKVKAIMHLRKFGMKSSTYSVVDSAKWATYNNRQCLRKLIDRAVR